MYPGISKNYNYKEIETRLMLAQDEKQGRESKVIPNSHTQAFCRKNYGYLVLIPRKKGITTKVAKYKNINQ
jgi:hypothetical protein